jgi:hypothetical protein
VQIAPHAPAVSKERVIGDDLGQDYAFVMKGMVESIAINAMTATNQNQMETFLHATFVEQDTRVKTVKPAQKAMQEKIAVFAIQGGNHGQMLPFYFLTRLPTMAGTYATNACQITLVITAHDAPTGTMCRLKLSILMTRFSLVSLQKQQITSMVKY